MKNRNSAALIAVSAITALTAWGRPENAVAVRS